MQMLNRATLSSRASTLLSSVTTRSIPATATSAFRRSPTPAPHRQRWKVRANDRVPNSRLPPAFGGVDAGTHVIAGAVCHDGRTTITTTGFYRAQSGDAASEQVYAQRGRRPDAPRLPAVPAGAAPWSLRSHDAVHTARSILQFMIVLPALTLFYGAMRLRRAELALPSKAAQGAQCAKGPPAGEAGRSGGGTRTCD